MGSIVSKIADEIKLHGSWEAYCDWQKQMDSVSRTMTKSTAVVAGPKHGQKCQVVVFERIDLK